MLSFSAVIPTKENVSRKEPLNILCVVTNDAEEITADISVWGKFDEEWEILVTQNILIQSEEHKHLYFTLPSKTISDGYWGKEIEEIEICVSDHRPKSGTKGILIFIN